MAADPSHPYSARPAREFSAAGLGADNGRFVLQDELVDKYGNSIAPIQDGKDMYAAMVCRLLECALAAETLTPTVRITVRFSTGTPVVDSFRSKDPTFVLTDITFIDNGDGDTTVRIPIAKLPPKRGEPCVSLHEGTKTGITVIHFADVDYRGARVKSWDTSTATDLKFTVEIW